MRAVHKYALQRNGETKLRLPLNAWLLRVDLQAGVPHVWVLNDPEATRARAQVTVRIVATGEPIPDSYAYVSTFFEDDGALVWHAFMLAEPE